MMSFNFSKFLEDMSTEPYVLFVGEKFDYRSDDGKRIMDLPWSCVVTSIRDEDFINGFDSEKRYSRDLVDISQIQQRIFEKSNLSIVRLFSTSKQDVHPDTYKYERKDQLKAYDILNKLAQMLDVSGKIIVSGYGINDRLCFDRFLDFCQNAHDSAVIFFGYSFENKSKAMEEIFEEKRNQYFTEDLSEYLPESIPLVEEYVDEDINHERIYVNNKIYTIDKKSLIPVRRVAMPVTLETINEIIVPPYLIMNFFYRFIKESPYKPQWYGYPNQFNIVREYEKELYNETLKVLDAPGENFVRPICLAGQSGSGKSIALANLAYRIFNERKYPVLFVNNKDTSYVFYESRVSEYVINGFDAISSYMENMKGYRAKSVLLILDCSVSNYKERKRCVRLFDSLTKVRGYNVCVVFSSYEIEENEVQSNEYKLVSSEVNIDTDSEVRQLRKILKRKAKFTSEEIDCIVGAIYEKSGYDRNLMSLLYRVFFEVRPSMELGIRREALSTIKGVLSDIQSGNEYMKMTNDIVYAFKKAYVDMGNKSEITYDNMEICVSSEDIKLLLISVAICTVNNLPMPCNMAYRLLDSTDYRIIKRVFKIPFFVFNEKTLDGDYEVWIRTRLEANMLLRAYGVDADYVINTIVEIINKIKGLSSYSYNAEIDMVTKLLHNIGPNSDDKRKRANYRNRKYYEEIIAALKAVREEYGGNPRLTLQEIVYMRELTILWNGEDDETRNIVLRRAILIGEEEVSKMGYAGSQRMKDMLTVEISNSRLRLNSGHLIDILDCQTIQRECMRVIQHNPENPYAYTAMLRGALLELNAISDEMSKLQIVSRYCDIIDQIRGEHPEIAEQEELFAISNEFYKILNGVLIDESVFYELLEKKSDAGIHLKVKQILQENNIDLYKKNDSGMTDEQVDVCKNVCRDILENEKYIEITARSERCQQVLLRIKWLIYNREPIFCGEKRFTYIPESGWKELVDICVNYKNVIYNEEVNYYRANTMFYILALCYAQLKQFSEATAIINVIREKTEKLYFNNRILVKHIICDPYGKPKEFAGKFSQQTQPDEIRGYVILDEVPNGGGYGKRGVYYHKASMKNTARVAGQRYTDFQLGLGFMGLAAFRGLLNRNINEESL